MRLLDLTSVMMGLAYRYHLRSNSGSNGPVAKESHRFLVAGPFIWTPDFGRPSIPTHPFYVLATAAARLRAQQAHPCSGANRFASGPPTAQVPFLLSAESS